MTGQTEVELILDRYLADGAERVPDRVIDAALDQIDSTAQRRVLRLPWSLPALPAFVKPALAGAAVVAAIALGWTLLERGPRGTVGTTPSPTSSPSASPSPPPATGWSRTFDSPLYGYSVGAPEGWEFQPSTEVWRPREGRFGEAPLDFITPRGEQLVLRAGSGLIPEGAEADDWIARFVTHTDIAVCGPPRETLEVILIDGQPGRLRDSCGEVEATVVVGQRVYVFTLFVNAGTSEPGRSGGRGLFDAFAASIRLTPATAYPASPAPR